MWVYLNKKVSIPNGLRLNNISWNGYHGWIACAGEQGLLKVLKLETKSDSHHRGVTAPTTLEFNQTLYGHIAKNKVDQSQVFKVCWNEEHDKLTSSDANGLIIVWMYKKHKKEWIADMENNRDTVVNDFKWSSDGQKICIVYEDGAVIVGSVGGDRNWGKSLMVKLTSVEWSPDGRYLLFGTAGGEVWLVDSNSGAKLHSLQIQCVERNQNTSNEIAGIDWYDGREGYPDLNAPTLAICYKNGRCQLMRGDLDDDPVLIDSGMFINEPKWNPSGTILALAGHQEAEPGKLVGLVQFYTPYGNHVKTLKVPGNGVKSLTWEGSGLRLALAVDANIFFANIRPEYKWGYFSKTLVYSYTKIERPEHCVVFYNHKTGQKFIKYIKRLLALEASSDHCVLLTKTETPKESYVIIICNSIGSPVETKFQAVEPKFVSMTKYHVIVSSDCNVYVWNYRPKQSDSNLIDVYISGSHKKNDENQYLFNIDENKIRKIEDEAKLGITTTSDAICCIFANERFLVIARESGIVNVYSLSQSLTFIGSADIQTRAQKIAVNSDCTKMSVIDINGNFNVFQVSASPPSPEKKKKKGMQ
ncbi:hypothetical protein ABK040_002224 [Willaertia magna]